MQSAVSTALPPRRRLVLLLILRITPMIHAGIQERQVEIFVLIALLSLVSKPLLASRIWLRLLRNCKLDIGILFEMAKRTCRIRRGQAVIFLALSMVVLCGMLGLVVD